MTSERGAWRVGKRDERVGAARAQCMVERGLDGGTRGQNASDLGRVLFPVICPMEQRLLIPREQLLALLCILGLAGRLELRNAGSGTSRGQMIQGVR